MRRSLVLASTSAYRKELLARLQIPFSTFAPAVDESPRAGEAAPVCAARLARAKARAATAAFPDALIIGSDQVASLDDELLGKPGSRDRAFAQLRRASGRTVSFFTAVALLDSESGAISVRTVPCHVRFRPLRDDLIGRYLDREQPYDCAGSAKAEGLGITLLERLDCADPTALIGLPLIALTELLGAHGLVLPAS
jgi:septum formation protein